MKFRTVDLDYRNNEV